MLSVRDIMRCWAEDGATCELPHDEPATRAGEAPSSRMQADLDRISGF